MPTSGRVVFGGTATGVPVDDVVVGAETDDESLALLETLGVVSGLLLEEAVVEGVRGGCRGGGIGTVVEVVMLGREAGAPLAVGP